MTTNPLDEFAPPLDTEEQVTADSMARRFTVQAFAEEAHVHDLALRAASWNPDPADVRAYVEAFQAFQAKFSLAFLLRALAEMAPEKADGVAKHLWGCWRDGGCLPEFLWDWLKADGIDPERVRAVAEAQQRDAA